MLQQLEARSQQKQGSRLKECANLDIAAVKVRVDMQARTVMIGSVRGSDRPFGPSDHTRSSVCAGQSSGQILPQARTCSGVLAAPVKVPGVDAGCASVWPSLRTLREKTRRKAE